MKVIIFTAFILISILVVIRSRSVGVGYYSSRYNDEKSHNFARVVTRFHWRKMILDIYRDTADIITKCMAIQMKSRFSAPFEVGYVWCDLEERYRRMVDKYQQGRVLHRNLYMMEMLLYLTDIELEYWTIEHMTGSLQTLERKYLIFNHLTENYKDTLLTRRTTKSLTLPDMAKLKTSPPRTRHDGMPRTTRRLKHATDFNLSWSRALTRRTNKRFWWPMEYGWEIDWEWNDDADFKKDIRYHDKTDTNFTVTDDFMRSSEERELWTKKMGANEETSSLVQPHWSAMDQIPASEKRILDELTWPLRLMLLKDRLAKPTTERTRQVGMESLIQFRRTEEPSENDESNMKMKLFRLMYETVRENDLKTKRAELIKVHYSNSTSFEIGYLMGDVTDKYNVMTDIALTLKRLYNDWKPLEHINAYEQIANQAIEIAHIVEMINSAAKRDAATSGTTEAADTETTARVTTAATTSPVKV